MENLNAFASAVYLDLEWDCGQLPHAGAPPEIIEIGLAELDPVSLVLIREENYLVRPNRVDLSLPCSTLTGIDSSNLLHAPRLPEVVANIGEKWSSKSTCFAWGCDGEVLTRACQQRHLAPPFRRFVDLSTLFQNLYLLYQKASVRCALEMLGLPFDGGQHMAVIDARNIALMHAAILRRIRSIEIPTAIKPALPKVNEITWFGTMLRTSLDAGNGGGATRSGFNLGKRDDHDAEITA